MIRPPRCHLQFAFAGICAVAFAVMLILAPVLLKQEVKPDSISRFTSPVSLRDLPKKEEPEETPPEEEHPEPPPPPQIPTAAMEIQVTPVVPVQPELLNLDIATNLATAVAISIPKQNSLFSLGEVDEPPIPIFTPPPSYPHRAERKRLETKLTIQMIVAADGSVHKAEVQHGEFKNIFGKSALKAVSRWRFKPARLHGKPVAVLVSLPLEFLCTK
ncbi:energy transducer TonB [Halodesulfovibrio aestuarii]|uniref:energy transducer TonB n=1 Tax=Halodesulfovibrio aestuarii TaxID=126333 RepID=UPI00352220B2